MLTRTVVLCILSRGKRYEAWPTLQSPRRVINPYLEELGDDRDSGNIDETSSGEEENVGRHASKLAAEQPDEGAEHGANGRGQLQQDGLALGAAGLDKDGKVSNLVRHLA